MSKWHRGHLGSRHEHPSDTTESYGARRVREGLSERKAQDLDGMLDRYGGDVFPKRDPDPFMGHPRNQNSPGVRESIARGPRQKQEIIYRSINLTSGIRPLSPPNCVSYPVDLHTTKKA